MRLHMVEYRFFIFLTAVMLLDTRPIQAQPQHLRDSLLTVYRTTPSDTGKVWALMKTGKLYLDSEPDTAVFYLQQALALAERIGFQRGIARCRINKAVAVFDLGQYDTVLTLCQSVIPICENLKMGIELVATYNLMGNTWSKKGNAWQAIAFFEKCLSIIETTPVPPHFPVVVNDNLSNLYNGLKLYDKGIAYAQNSLRQAEAINDEKTMGTAAQHLGNAYLGLQRLDSALLYFQRSVDIARKIEYSQLLTISLSNVAEIHHLQGDDRAALALYQEGLQLSRKYDNKEAIVYNLHGLSLTAFDARKFKEADQYAKEALKMAEAIQLSDYSYAIYLTLSDIALANGDLEAWTNYRIQYRQMRDAIASKALVHAVQELETKYQTEQKVQQINQLQQEAELQQLRLQRKNDWLWGLGLFSLLALTAVWLIWHNARNRKKILEQTLQLQDQTIIQLQQKQQLITADALLRGQEDERSRLARDLHDGLGGMLSGIKHSLHNMAGNQILPDTSAQSLHQVINDLDRSIGELRLIARNMMPEALVRFGLPDALKDCCDHLSELTALPIHFQTFGMAQRLDPQQEVILFRIAQELLNNVVKHSGASTALLQLLRDGDRVSLTVEDNGKGFDASQLEQVAGVGWLNIRSRVNYLNGTLDLRAEPGQGTSVTVEIGV